MAGRTSKIEVEKCMYGAISILECVVGLYRTEFQHISLDELFYSDAFCILRFYRPKKQLLLFRAPGDSMEGNCELEWQPGAVIIPCALQHDAIEQK